MRENELDKSLSAYYDVDRVYSFDNKIILNWYPKRIIDKFTNAISVLDLGLGHGTTANILFKHFSDYTVLEGSQEIINKFKTKFPENTANIVNTFFENFNSDKHYDLIIMGFILEHVKDPVQIMKYYKSFLKPENGIMILSVPNAQAMNRRLGYYAGFLDDIAELSETDQELGHLRYYTIDTFKQDIEKADLKVKNIEGIYIKPFTTKQIMQLNFDEKVLDALCMLGIEYPELSLGIMAECEI
jgi:2-polyprenyl-3-methyl-5-hydroxy-6-metoxy-1,4-benzoquinol methylase